MKTFRSVVVLLGMIALLAGSHAWAAEGPVKPQPQPVTLDSKTTALLVMDLHARCNDPREICSKLIPDVALLLEKARAASVPIIYAVSLNAKGTPLGEAAAGFKRRETEPIVYPDHSDKFWGGEIDGLLKQKGIKTVVLMGASAHTTVLHSAATAARVYKYNVIVPIDGTISRLNYEMEYAFHHLSVYPGGVNKLFQFTRLAMISFQ